MWHCFIGWVVTDVLKAAVVEPQLYQNIRVATYFCLICTHSSMLPAYYYFHLTHCSFQGLLCDLGSMFQLSPPDVSTRVTTQEHPAAEGGTVGEKCPGILPKCRLLRYIWGYFTCRKATTWDRQLYFPSEGRRAENFFRLKNPMDANPRTWVPKPARYLYTTEAAMLPT
jgi:hypothetical protein